MTEIQDALKKEPLLYLYTPQGNLLSVCYAYEINGSSISYVPYDPKTNERVEEISTATGCFIVHNSRGMNYRVEEVGRVMAKSLMSGLISGT